MDFLKSIITQLILLRPNHSSVWITLRYAFVAGVGLMTTIVLTRWLSPEAYGTYQYFLALIAFFSFLSLPGFNMAALKAVAEGSPKGVIQAIRHSFLCGWLIVPSVLLWVSFVGNESGISIFWLFWICLLAVPFYALNTWYVFYEGQQNFFDSTWRVMLGTAITFATLIILVFLQLSPSLLLIGYFLSGAMSAFVFCIEIFFKIDRKNKKTSIDTIYGYKATLQKFFFTLSETLPLILIGLRYGSESLAIFQVAFFIYSSFAGYLGSLSSTMLPNFFLGIQVNWKKVLIRQGAIGLVIVILLIAVTVLFFPILFHESYSESQSILFMLIPFSFLLPLRSYLFTYFIANSPGYLTMILFIANVFASAMFFIFSERSMLLSGVSYLGTLIIILVSILFYRYYQNEKLKKCDL